MPKQLLEGVTKVHVFERYLRASTGRILDVGCGLGGTLRYVPTDVCVFGVDRSHDYCVKARMAGQVTLCADIAHGLPVRDRSIAVVVCSDVFEHLVQPLALLHEIHRVLRPDGRLLCHVPNEFSAKSLRQVMRGDGICNRGFFPDAEEWNYPHLRFFSHKGFRRMLERAGFVVEADLTNFGRGWRRHLYPLFGSGPSFVGRRVAGAAS
jgi:SAM-dependent methyltransferase